MVVIGSGSGVGGGAGARCTIQARGEAAGGGARTSAPSPASTPWKVAACPWACQHVPTLTLQGISTGLQGQAQGRPATPAWAHVHVRYTTVEARRQIPSPPSTSSLDSASPPACPPSPPSTLSSDALLARMQTCQLASSWAHLHASHGWLHCRSLARVGWREPLLCPEDPSWFASLQGDIGILDSSPARATIMTSCQAWCVECPSVSCTGFGAYLFTACSRAPVALQPKGRHRAPFDHPANQ